MIPKRQRGKHTWDMICVYHRCPQCDYIIENRDPYEYQLGKYIKHLECARCHHAFTEEKVSHVIGPIFGR